MDRSMSNLCLLVSFLIPMFPSLFSLGFHWRKVHVMLDACVVVSVRKYL